MNICLHEFTVSEGRASWIDAFEPLVLLSTAILEPLEEVIVAVEHIIFISSGDLTQFPFGTLIFESANLIMQKAASQAPSLYGLLYLITRDISKNSIGKFSLVAKPGSLREARKTREPDFPMAGIEAILLAYFFSTEPRKRS